MRNLSKALLVLFAAAAAVGGFAWLIIPLEDVPSNAAHLRQDAAALPDSAVDGPPTLQPLERANSATTRDAGEEMLPPQRGRDVPQESARTFASVEGKALELDFEAKHGEKSLDALRQARAVAYQSLNPLWDREMDAYIARGMAEFTPESSDGTLSVHSGPQMDPDVCLGAKSGDGGMYTVELRREFSPDLFMLVDEIAWLGAAIKEAEARQQPAK